MRFYVRTTTIDGFNPEDFEGNRDAPEKEDIYWLKMTCPSTGFIHALRVPLEMTSTREAIRWVNWDIEPEELGASHFCDRARNRSFEAGGRRKEKEGRRENKCFYKYEMLPGI